MCMYCCTIRLRLGAWGCRERGGDPCGTWQLLITAVCNCHYINLQHFKGVSACVRLMDLMLLYFDSILSGDPDYQG
jgi:hypothetical protein